MELLELKEVAIWSDGKRECVNTLEEGALKFFFRPARGQILNNVYTGRKVHGGGRRDLANMALGYAVATAMSYKKQQQHLSRFVAEKPEDENHYRKMIRDMLRTGKYKLVKEKRVRGKMTWEVVQKH